MKYFFILVFISCTGLKAQINIQQAEDSTVKKYQIGTYSYMSKFIGKANYGAPLILTADGGSAAFGDSEDKVGKGGMLVKVNKTGKLVWKKIIRPQFNEIESQAVVQDTKGNLFVYMLSYNEKKYRGGCERVVCLNKDGKILWDKLIGSCELMNNPTVSYIKALGDGRIALRGHVVIEKPMEGKDPSYVYWEGWLDATGKLTQKTGEVIDWSNKDQQKKFEPEN